MTNIYIYVIFACRTQTLVDSEWYKIKNSLSQMRDSWMLDCTEQYLLFWWIAETGKLFHMLNKVKDRKRCGCFTSTRHWLRRWNKEDRNNTLAYKITLFRVSIIWGKRVNIKEEYCLKSNFSCIYNKMRNRKLIGVFQCARRNWITITL